MEEAAAAGEREPERRADNGLARADGAHADGEPDARADDHPDGGARAERGRQRRTRSVADGLGDEGARADDRGADGRADDRGASAREPERADEFELAAHALLERDDAARVDDEPLALA